MMPACCGGKLGPPLPAPWQLIDNLEKTIPLRADVDHYVKVDIHTISSKHHRAHMLPRLKTSSPISFILTASLNTYLGTPRSRKTIEKVN